MLFTTENARCSEGSFYVSAFTDRTFDYINKFPSFEFVSFVCPSSQSTFQPLRKKKIYRTKHAWQYESICSFFGHAKMGTISFNCSSGIWAASPVHLGIIQHCVLPWEYSLSSEYCILIIKKKKKGYHWLPQIPLIQLWTSLGWPDQ